MKTKTRSEDVRQTDGDFRDQHPGAGEQAGEAVGGIGGTLAGAALGAAGGGPVGMILGGLAGAFGGWWAGEKAGRAAEDMHQREPYYRSHFEAHARPDFGYDEARVGYGVGELAGHNPDYVGRSFAQIEGDLRRGWIYEAYDFDTMRPYVRAAYERTAADLWPNEPK